MKKFFLILILLTNIICNHAFGQAGEWTWIQGSNSPNNFATFGTQGIAAPANTPAALYEPVEWTDLNGNFWLFGGAGPPPWSGYDALWKYDISTNEWTWMTGTTTVNDFGVYGIMGVPSPTNRPRSKAWGCASWVDLNGNLWMFGGGDAGANIFNDLWKYNISTNEWTWINGSNNGSQPAHYGIKGVPDTLNNPGARSECSAAWTDNAGDLWLFGGIGLNDLWRYNIATNTWTWMNGSSNTNQAGVYGTIGVEAPLNSPGARMSYSHWKDNNGNLWLFGGGSYSSGLFFNDLWRYNPVTNNWAWMSGSNATNPTGFYGPKCSTNPQNIPAPRFENRSVWTDQDGNFWLFGGGAYSGGIFNVLRNDLWKYCVNTNQWIWISGDSISGPSGNWGTLGVPGPTNKPDGRAGAVGWKDHNNHIYLFGGYGTGNSSYNDLWKYTIDTTCSPCAANINLPIANFVLSDSIICSGDCINFTNISQNSNSYQWFFPGGTPVSDTSANPHGICYFNSGTFDVTLIATNNNGSDTLTLPNFITIHPQIPFSALTQNGDTLFSIPGYPSYEWYDGLTLINGANNYYFIATHSGNYSIVVTDSNGCFATAQKLNVIASVNNIVTDINDFNVQYNSGIIYLKIISSNSVSSEFEITDDIGKIICQRKISIDKGKNEIEIPGINLSSGIYFIKLLNDKKGITGKFYVH